MNFNKQIGAKIVFYLLILVSLYYSTFQWLIYEDLIRDDFSYGYLIPFIVLYLIWEKRSALFSTRSEPSWLGIIPFCLGLILYWLGELAGEFFTLYISFWLLLVGICWLNLGWKKIKILYFAFFITLTMFPLPYFIYNKISVKLKLFSSHLGVEIMQLYGMSAYREGNIIDLGFTQLQVVDACSGLRYLFPLIVLSILLAYFFRAPIWKKVVLISSSIPLTIFTNSLRIAITGILYEMWGPYVAEGFFHGFSGWFIFMFALGALLIEMWVLSGFRSSENKLTTDPHKPTQIIIKSFTNEPVKAEPPQESSQEHSSIKKKNIENPGDRITWLKAFLSPPQYVVAIILLGLTLVLSLGVEFREKIPIAKSFDEFPNKIGEWTGKSQMMEQIILDELDLSDYIMVNFSNGYGKWVNFYTAYYESQRKGESIHSPATCLPGSGWVFKEGGSAHIPMPGHKDGSIPVNRAFMIKSGYRQLSYYWFSQRDRILANAFQLKLYNFWDALTRQRTDGALVRVITPVYDNEELADAEKRLQSFTQAIVPVLDEFLPD